MDTKINELTKIWDQESNSYRFANVNQPDYLSDFYHIERNFGQVMNKKILEVGSGSGLISAYLASKGGAVHLVDISKKSLDFSKKYFASKKLPLKFYLQDAFNMNFPDESFDYVWNGGVIEHFNDYKKVLLIKKMWKLVKPGGKMLISVPNSLDIPFIIAKKILQVRGKWSFGEEDDLTVGKMVKLANLAGIKLFTIYAYNPIVGFWFFPYGRELTNLLRLNKPKYHKKVTPFGHVILFCATKTT